MASTSEWHRATPRGWARQCKGNKACAAAAATSHISVSRRDISWTNGQQATRLMKLKNSDMTDTQGSEA